MYVCIFIDWENIEKTVKQDYGSILVFSEFVKSIKETAISNGSRLVGIQAYGDFDKGTAGLMSQLVNLGVEPKHVVTKTSHQYLKNSTDIELALDVLETMYNYPHISDFLFVSGDADLRHVITRLRKQGKNLRLLGFKSNTSQFLIDMVNEYIPLDNFPNIMRKVSQPERDLKLQSLLSNTFAQIIIEQMYRLESDGRSFVGLNYIRKRLTDYYQESVTEISDALTECIDCGILETYQVPNPNDPKHPTRACKLNRNNENITNIFKQL